MLQVDDVFKMMTEVHKEYNALLSVEQQGKGEDWFDVIDISMLQFKQKIHGWIRDVNRERDAAMAVKSKSLSVSESLSSQRSSRHSSVTLSGSKSSKSDKALKEKLRMAELLMVSWRRDKQQNSVHKSGWLRNSMQSQEQE